MPTTSKAAILREIRPPESRPFTIEELPIPPLTAGAILGRLRMAGVCGIDVHILHGRVKIRTPAILGHENVAEVVASAEMRRATTSPGRALRQAS